ncbi:MAG: PHP domain-containing protein [Candidatus Ratteibacteria bacterium]|nr:PHP domain-containing protein [Candidatus Ratteibacteria bacterium]
MNARKINNSKIVPETSISQLLNEGWHEADLHVHTYYSPDVLPSTFLDPLVLYEKARQKGMKYISFTDHDTMEAYDRVGWKKEGLVPGVEIKVKDMENVGHSIHVNIYELNKSQFQELMEIAKVKRDIFAFISYLKGKNLPFVYNHPYWYDHGEKPNFKVVHKLLQLFPVTEYNMHRVWQKNALAMKLAHRYSKGIIAATDTHVGDIGRASTFAKGETFREFFDNIAKGEVYLNAQDLTVRILREEINTWIDLIFNLDIERLEKVVHTQIRTLNYFINWFLRGAFEDYPILRKAAERFFSSIAKSGAPALCYMELQNFLVYKMNRQLRTVEIN